MLNIFAKETQEISQSSFLGFHFNNNIIEYKNSNILTDFHGSRYRSVQIQFYSTCVCTQFFLIDLSQIASSF